jgi:hypothetical protein
MRVHVGPRLRPSSLSCVCLCCVSVFVYDVGQSEVEKLQAQYKKLQEGKEEAVAAVKASGLGLMKAVKAANKKK